MRLINSAFFGRTPNNLKDVKDVPISMQIPLLVLSILCFAFGVYPQWILSVFVNPGVSAFTGMSLSELNSAITGLGFRTGIGLYEATGLTLAVIASILVGAAIYKTTTTSQPSDATGDKYGVFIGGEANLPYIDVERTDVKARTFTYAAERTLGELQNVMWIARIDHVYYSLASGVQKLCDAASAGITSRIGLIASAAVIFGSTFLGPHYPGLLLMILGAITALAQKKLARLLICAAATQIGWITMIIAFEYPKGLSEALFYLMNFAVFGILLTLSSWSVVRKTGTNEITDLRGLSSKMPVAAIAFLAGGLSMSGVPAFGGWIDEFYFIRSTLETGRIELTAIGIAVSILTLGYVLRTFNQVFLGELPERYKEVKGSSAAEIGLMVILVALAVLIGVAPHFFMSYITKLVSIVS
jgi:formate hydrogenlyase subunit 3/multisubunit Na+/H+ antiporter MnhD subunit